MIILYVDHFERLDFYSRFTDLDRFILFTARYSVYRKAKSMGMNIYLFNKNSRSNVSIDIEKARDYLDGTLTFIDAKMLSQQVYGFVSNTLELLNARIEYCFIWNGSDVIDKALAKYSLDNEIQLIYFEISNLPNRLFIDGLGVNAASSLMKIDDVYKLDCLENSSYEESFYGFISKYKSFKSGDYVPQQARFMSKINVNFIFDYLYSLFKGVKFQSKKLHEKFAIVLSRVLNKKIKLGKEVDINCNYIFLPLQVSNDSQILINSNVTNCDAIRYVVKEAIKENVKLYVKIHPAEKDKNRLIEYNSLASELDFELSINNTNVLIENAQKVYTINSTVGLEAMLFGKEVDFLGETVFKLFNNKNIELYIDKFLFECDYFGSEKINTEKVIRHCLELKKVLVKNER